MLELYILETCPYCKNVIENFNKRNIKFELHNISNSAEFDRLMQLGGLAQVPFLYDTDNDVRLYESDKIIQYR